MSDIKSIIIRGIGEVDLISFDIQSDTSTLVLIKVVDHTSHLLAKWHNEAVVQGKRDPETFATLTQIDGKTFRDKLNFEFKGVVPVYLSLAPGSGKGRAREKLELAYESYKDRSPVSLEFAARGFVPQG